MKASDFFPVLSVDEREGAYRDVRRLLAERLASLPSMLDELVVDFPGLNDRQREELEEAIHILADDITNSGRSSYDEGEWLLGSYGNVLAALNFPSASPDTVPDREYWPTHEGNLPQWKCSSEQWCKYCHSTHTNWWVMDQTQYLYPSGTILLCGYCRYTSMH
jgi:hypothetical protein